MALEYSPQPYADYFSAKIQTLIIKKKQQKLNFKKGEWVRYNYYSQVEIEEIDNNGSGRVELISPRSSLMVSIHFCWIGLRVRIRSSQHFLLRDTCCKVCLCVSTVCI